MARLTRRQLAAIFAKLKLQKLAGAAVKSVASPLSGARMPRVRAGASQPSEFFKPERMEKLLARLPQSHISMSKTKNVVVGDMGDFIRGFRIIPDNPDTRAKFAGVKGGYNKLTHNIFILDEPYESPMISLGGRSIGYGKIPSWKEAGRRRPHFDFEKQGLPYSQTIQGRYATANRRNTRAKAAAALYHEFGHSIDKGHYSKASEWAKIAKAWGPTRRYSLGWGGAKTPLGESWAEAYGLYARSKVSRQRLKREAPEAYAYMKRFFENPESVRKSFYGEHRGEMAVAALAGTGMYQVAKRLKEREK